MLYKKIHISYPLAMPDKKFDAYSTEKGCIVTKVDPIALMSGHSNCAPSREKLPKKTKAKK